MSTAVAVMDRDEWGANTDNLVVVDPGRERLVWVPRDLWCPGLGARVSRAFALGGNAALATALAEHGLAVDHGVCLRRAAAERCLEGVSVTVPVAERLRFWYPLDPSRPIEEGRKLVVFEPPAERLAEERIHQWLGARYSADGAASDLDRIERQRALVASLIAQGFAFGRALADPALVSATGAPLEELRRVDPRWSQETFGPLDAATVEGMMVLVRPGAGAGPGPSA